MVKLLPLCGDGIICYVNDILRNSADLSMSFNLLKLIVPSGEIQNRRFSFKCPRWSNLSIKENDNQYTIQKDKKPTLAKYH